MQVSHNGSWFIRLLVIMLNALDRDVTSSIASLGARSAVSVTRKEQHVYYALTAVP